jgi:hypothetical protein
MRSPISVYDVVDELISLLDNTSQRLMFSSVGMLVSLSSLVSKTGRQEGGNGESRSLRSRVPIVEYEGRLAPNAASMTECTSEAKCTLQV